MGSDSCVVPLASAVQPLTQLQHLDLAGNNIKVPGLLALAPALSAMPALQTLVVSSNYTGWKARADWVEALCALLSIVPGLTHLNVVGSNSLLDEGVTLLAPVLRGMTGLQHLNLSTRYHWQQGNSGTCSSPCSAAQPAHTGPERL